MANIVNTDFLLTKSADVDTIITSPITTSRVVVGTADVGSLNITGSTVPWPITETVVLTGNWTGPMYNNPGPPARIVLTKFGQIVNLHIEFFSRACDNHVTGALLFTGTPIPDRFKPYTSDHDLIIQPVMIEFNTAWQAGTLSMESGGAMYIEPVNNVVWNSMSMYDANVTYTAVTI
jgi:hypothetical protein